MEHRRFLAHPEAHRPLSVVIFSSASEAVTRSDCSSTGSTTVSAPITFLKCLGISFPARTYSGPRYGKWSEVIAAQEPGLHVPVVHPRAVATWPPSRRDQHSLPAPGSHHRAGL